MLETLRQELARIAKENGLESERIRVVARPLTPEEAIGRPEELDYPLVKGKERLMQAELKGTPGQAFTDMFGEYEGTISGIRIEGPDKTRDNLLWCDVALVTGTTIVNGTIGEFLIQKPIIFYGVTISGAAKLLGLKHFCAYGRQK